MDLYQTTGISPNGDDAEWWNEGAGDDYGYTPAPDSWHSPHLTARPYFHPNGLDSGMGRTLPLHEPPSGWAMPTPPPDGDDEQVCRYWGLPPWCGRV